MKLQKEIKPHVVAHIVGFIVRLQETLQSLSHGARAASVNSNRFIKPVCHSPALKIQPETQSGIAKYRGRMNMYIISCPWVVCKDVLVSPEGTYLSIPPVMLTKVIVTTCLEPKIMVNLW